MALVRIIMHWSAGGHEANSSDKEHYHEIVEGDGSRVLGRFRPEANLSTSDGHYAAHVARFNTGSIGLSMACMKNATERPFKKGSDPMTKVQLDSFISMVAEYAEIYSIPIDRKHVLSHSEVSTTYPKKPQAGKWDINWLPGMAKPGNAIEVGDHLRELIQARHSEIYEDGSVMANADVDIDALTQALAAALAEHLASIRAA